MLLHGRRDVFIQWGKGDKDEREREADVFASELLIPQAAYEAFLRRFPTISAASIEAFADQQSIAPGIVVGRLKHDEKLAHADLNGLRARYVWTEGQGDDDG